MGMDSGGKYLTLKSRTPLAELYGFSTVLRSLTQGKASFTSKFAEFTPVSIKVQEELMAQREEMAAEH
jgi:elongation factor G